MPDGFACLPQGPRQCFKGSSHPVPSSQTAPQAVAPQLVTFWPIFKKTKKTTEFNLRFKFSRATVATAFAFLFRNVTHRSLIFDRRGDAVMSPPP